MTKRFKNWAIATTLATLFFYALTAFVKGSINPYSWSEEARVFIALTTTFGGVMAAVVIAHDIK